MALSILLVGSVLWSVSTPNIARVFIWKICEVVLPSSSTYAQFGKGTPGGVAGGGVRFILVIVGGFL